MRKRPFEERTVYCLAKGFKGLEFFEARVIGETPKFIYLKAEDERARRAFGLYGQRPRLKKDNSYHMLHVSETREEAVEKFIAFTEERREHFAEQIEAYSRTFREFSSQRNLAVEMRRLLRERAEQTPDSLSDRCLARRDDSRRSPM